jgi:hypothetical protein
MKYYCRYCNQILEREYTKNWAWSFCAKVGKRVRIYKSLRCS